MLTCPTHVPIYFFARPVDLRKSFDGLCGLVESALGRHVTDGHLFLFVNKRQDRLKALWWEAGGLVIWYKRLEQGTLELPRAGSGQSHVTLDVAQLAMLLAGVPLDQARRRKRMQQAGSV
jgi:transposase